MFSFEDTTSCKACQMLLRWETRIMSSDPSMDRLVWETVGVGGSEEREGPGEAVGSGVRSSWVKAQVGQAQGESRPGWV